MGTAEFMGMLIAAIVVLMGLGASIVKPIIKLNTNIVKLNVNIESLVKKNESQDKRLDRHGQEIDELKVRVNGHDIEIENLKKKG